MPIQNNELLTQVFHHKKTFYIEHTKQPFVISHILPFERGDKRKGIFKSTKHKIQNKLNSSLTWSRLCRFQPGMHKIPYLKYQSIEHNVITLVCWIDVHARLLILRKKSPCTFIFLHLYWYLPCMFINFEKKIPNARPYLGLHV